MSTKEAFEIVYNELIKCNLFQGHYDAKNGSTQFMYGIETAMELISEYAGTSEEFSEIFSKNMISCLKKAERI